MAKAKQKYAVDEKKQVPPPVVAILGHVDHGKTTLLDNIRKTHVAEKEVGGITQHISAYKVDIKGDKITFIDTPGHEAFSKMRARGAKIVDLAILVVAGDDGVMPQTEESIAHIKTAAVPFIVAINKMDSESANVDRVKKQLAEKGVLVEGYGGDVVAVPISAKTGKGVDELLEMINLVAEMSEIKKNKSKPFEGVVVESFLDKFRGPLATIILKNGSLKVGDLIYGDTTAGKVKALLDSNGNMTKEAVVSDPVTILGLESVPVVGDTFTKKEKSRISEKKKNKVGRDWEEVPKSSEIRLVLKADTYGSLEAISNSIESLKEKDQEVKFIHKETGDITENDILLAAAAKAVIIGFNVKTQSSVEKIAEEEGVNIRSYKLIYELLDELKEGLAALAEAKKKKDIIGEAEILAKFKSDEGVIAGAKVTKGRINISDNLIILRGGKEIKESKIKSMKHKLSTINEVDKGKEFGILFDSKVKFEQGDIIHAIKE